MELYNNPKGTLMDTEETTSIWNKKPEDLTVGETVKYSAVATVVVTAACFLPWGVVAGIDKIKMVRVNRKAKKMGLTVVK